MGSAPIGRSSSPIGSNNNGSAASRYSLGGTSKPAPSTPSADQMYRKAQQQHQSQDGRSPAMAGGGGPTGTYSLGGAATAARFGPRPSSEMIGMQAQAGFGGVSESEAMEKWFEDLHHYETTLEEMAAASLDQNFKEELSAIEQWFRVLSEAERTAALYSLLQEATQVQIRFFITVLQQMARSDPVGALLSPGQNNHPMADQMEAKLASLGLKSPTAMKSPATPANRSYQRQSEAFLSPNAAQLTYSPSGAGSEAAALLAAQRAKLKANRVSAPGTFTGDQRGGFSVSGGNLDQVQERGNSPNPMDRSRSPGADDSMRPKSIDALANSGDLSTSTPRRAGPLDDQLSPIPSGNWSSMVNTPMSNLFDDNRATVTMDAAASQLAHLAQQSGQGNVMLESDLSKYQRRKSGQPGYDQQPHSPNLNSGAGWGGSAQNDFLRQAMATPQNLTQQQQYPTQFQTMSPNSFAGLQSPSGGFGNGLNMQMMNAMAAMGGLNNVNAAQFLAMQQQILQNQQQIAAMAAATQHAQSSGSRNRSHPGLQAPGQRDGGRRSPAPGMGRQGLPTPPSAKTNNSTGEEEVPDLTVLEDVAAWLRHLRLHKYTPNFQDSDWKKMTVMTDADLEAKGVAALGARRKLLKTFSKVREKYGIKGPDDGEKAGDNLKATGPLATGAGADSSPSTAPTATATTNEDKKEYVTTGEDSGISKDD